MYVCKLQKRVPATAARNDCASVLVQNVMYLQSLALHKHDAQFVKQ